MHEKERYGLTHAAPLAFISAKNRSFAAVQLH